MIVDKRKLETVLELFVLSFSLGCICLTSLFVV